MIHPQASFIARLTAALAVACMGCSSIPEGRSAVDDVEVEGATAIDEDDIVGKLATRPNPKFLWLIEGLIYDYEIFNRFVLERDLARIERLYRARGHYEARVRAGRIFREDDDEVRVQVVVEEGPITTVERVALLGEGLDQKVRSAMMARIDERLPLGEPFREEDYETLEDELAAVLHDRGYAWAKVQREADVDLVDHEAFVRYEVRPGPKATFGEVTIEGLGELPDEEVRATFDIQPGQPYSAHELELAHQRTLDLGVFSSVKVEPQLGEGVPDKGRPVPIEVRVEPSELHTIRAGGGIALDAIKSDIHLLAGWEDRNLFGGLRRFTVDVRPGVVLYPLRVNNWVAPEKPLPTGQLDIRLEQPDFLEQHTVGFVAPKLSVLPVLLRTNPSPEDPVVGYVDTGVAVGVERPWWEKRMSLSVQKHLRYALPFSYVGEKDPLLKHVLLGYPEVVADLDLRDDPVHPHAGIHFLQRAQAALYHQALDLKLVPELRGYIPLGPVTLASKAKVGLLFPFNYADTLQSQLDADAAGRTRPEVRDLQLMFFRGLFAGGPTSNRGYPPRLLAPHAVVPFLNPETEAASLAARCDSDETSRCATPVGGLTLWELSLALRFPIVEPLWGASFCDAADVAPGQVQFRPDYPHLSCGGGLRYDTPVGPIRLDVAYRIPGAQYPEDADPQIQGDPGTIFGAPVNIAVGIGEAF